MRDSSLVHLYTEGHVPPMIQSQLTKLVHHTWPMYPAVGWTQIRPAARLVWLEDDTVIGQVSLVHLSPDNHRVLGISDLLVRRERRREGIGRLLLEAAVNESDQRQATALMAAVVLPYLFTLLPQLGFYRTRRFDVYYQTGDSCHWSNQWFLRGALPSQNYRIVGDF